MIWTRARLAGLALALLVLFAGCASPGAPASTPQSSAAAPTAAPAAAAPKSIVMALSAEPSTVGPFEIGGSWFQGPIYQIMHDFLVVHDTEGTPHPHLATGRPSVDDGSWKVFPDGTMETTWHLRQGVTWQDGTEFTAQDVVFTWNVINNPRVPWSNRSVAQAIDAIQTPDPYTLVLHWKSSFPFADNPDETTLDPLPAHLLATSYNTDVDSFVNSSYWTRDFVGLGPYHLTSWTPGSQFELHAKDDYYLGRPKIGQITVLFITDPNVMIDRKSVV